jgi:Acetyltransferases
MGNIVYEVVQADEIEQCRDLCNALMVFQKSKATFHPECFDWMNFDSRMKKSFLSTPDSHVVVAKDNGVLVGYVFSTIERISDGDKSYIPDWAPKKTSDDYQGFYPDWDVLPARCGCLNNLYLKESHRGQGIASQLFDMTMAWMTSFKDVDVVFVYVSNGNANALDFYLKHGFVYSHEVFGGFIQAAYYNQAI